MGKKNKDIVETHKEELSSLAKSDPEFYQFLQENDSELLNFNVDEEFPEDENVLATPSTGSGNVLVTEEILKQFVDKTKSGSFEGLKSLLSIFRAACIPSGDVSEKKHVSRYIVSSAAVFERVMTLTLENTSVSFYKFLDTSYEELNKEVISNFDKHPKWKKIEMLVLSFFKSILHILSGLADKSAQQQSNVTSFMLASLEHYIPLLSPMKRLCSAVLKVLVGLWSVHEVVSEERSEVDINQYVRTCAFLRIWQMATKLPNTVAEDCFRALYLAYTRHCKSYNDQTSGSVNFMCACIIELCRTDITLAYQLGFVYIRQLALHLRNAIAKKTAELVKGVTSWQYLNCLRLWTQVICSLPSSGDSGLGELAYPLVQIMFGVMSIATSSANIPCKLHLIGFLHHIAAACETFVPTAPKLVALLEIPELLSKNTPSTEIAPKLSSIVRFSGDSVSKAVVKDAIVEEVVRLLRLEADIYRYHPGMPEYFYVTTRKLRAFLKKIKITKWRDLVKAVVSHIEQLSEECKALRAKLNKSPMEIGNEFEPLLKLAREKSSKGDEIGKSGVRLRKSLFGSSDNPFNLKVTQKSVKFNANLESVRTIPSRVDEEIVINSNTKPVKQNGSTSGLKKPKKAKIDTDIIRDEVRAMLASEWDDDDDDLVDERVETVEKKRKVESDVGSKKKKKQKHN